MKKKEIENSERMEEKQLKGIKEKDSEKGRSQGW